MAMNSLKTMLGGEETEDEATHIEAHKDDVPKQEAPEGEDKDTPLVEPNEPAEPMDEEAGA